MTIPIKSDGQSVTAAEFNELARFHADQFNVRSYGAVGDFNIVSGAGTDDTAAIQAAIDAASLVLGGVVYFPRGYYRITSKLTVKEGVTLRADGGLRGPVYHFQDGWTRKNATAIVVHFGSGLTALGSAALECQDRTTVKGFAFYYPGQSMTAAVPTAFPPTITIAATRHSVVLEDLVFVNSYVAVDCSRDHANLYAHRIGGFPIYRGFIIGSMTDNAYVSMVHFNPLYAYRGVETTSYQTWVAQNGQAFRLGRMSWSCFTDIFNYGYHTGFRGLTMSTDSDGGAITTPGGPENCHFTNCGADGCVRGFDFDGAAFGNVFTSCFAACNDIRATGLTTTAFRYVPTAAFKDVTLVGFRVHGTKHAGLYFEGASGVNLDQVSLLQWASGATAKAMEFNACDSVSITGGFLRDNSGNAKEGIVFDNGCSDFSVTGTKFYNFLANTALKVGNTGTQQRYSITQCSFRGGNVAGISDLALSATSFIGFNFDSSLSATNAPLMTVGGVEVLQNDRDGTLKTLKIDNQNSGGDPILSANSTAQTLDIEGVVRPSVDNAFNIGDTNRRPSSVDAVKFRVFGAVGDVNSATLIEAAKMEFGAGGALGRDVVLQRGDVDRLDLVAGDSFRITGGTTAVRDAIVQVNGMMWYNTDTSKLQVRAGGVWVDLH